MRFNNMIQENYKKSNFMEYMAITVIVAIAFTFFLNIVVQLLILAFQFVVKFWWMVIVGFFGLALLKRIWRGKK